MSVSILRQRRVRSLSRCAFRSLAAAASVLSFAYPAFAQQSASPTQSSNPIRDLFSDTWVGVDALGRVLPDNAITGPSKAHKTVGMFYFLTFERPGEGPYDNTKILAAHPEAINDIHNPAWGPLNSAHYWGEPLLGYYANDDEAILRKHAQMLVNAGVDMVVFDNSNAVTYDHERNTLCRVWEQMRREGERTPQIAFLCPFSNPANIGSSTLASLYDSIYAAGLYSDLWFRWNGKPLILADPSYANADGLHQEASRKPARISPGSTLGQTFTVDRAFLAAGGEFPTWGTSDSGMTLSLYAEGPRGRLIARQKFERVRDNAKAMVSVPHPLPAGRYYLEASEPHGQIGWWGYSADMYQNGTAFDTGSPAAGDRSLIVKFAGEPKSTTISPDGYKITPDDSNKRAQTIRDFFTFRSPIGPYNDTAPPADHWAWLQVYPQAPQRDASGKIEQITVGVAQNYNTTVNNTAPMSVPGAFGRSYHDGKLDTRPNATAWGFNFDEQWRRAREVDPPFVFVTGWNEWTAGFYDSWVSWHAPPPIFVDQFNEEYSRDIEPMRGGHGDNYYYQLVDNVRRYKGARSLPPVTPRSIKIDGRFDDWKDVAPEFRDASGDPARRSHDGIGKAGKYVNTTGRNDIVVAKVSFDRKNVYFYVRTRDAMTPHTDKDWMLLYINADGDYKTGWLGYDFVLNRRPGSKATSLERNLNGRYAWKTVAEVQYSVRGSELEITVPISIFGHLPTTIDFKWADHCFAKGDWTDFTLNGDAAPDDRFNYRAKLQPAR